MRVRTQLLSAALCAACFGPGIARAERPTIRRYEAVHIVFLDPLNVRDTRPGDSFTARTDHDSILPDGTYLHGHVINVHYPRRNRPASMDLEFTDLELPDGRDRHIEAIPVAPNDPHLTRDANGRLIAKYDPQTKQQYVFGGAVGGFLLGALGHRPIKGALLGALIGSLAADSDRRQNQDVIVSKGDKMVAVFESDLYLDQPEEAPATAGTPSGGWHTTERGKHRPPVEERIDLSFDDKPLAFKDGTAPFWIEDVVMVPVEQAAEQLDLDLTRHADGRISMDGPSGTMSLSVNSTAYHFNNTSGDLRHTVVEKDGIVYVPAEIFAALRPEKLKLNGNALHWRAY